jgi:hypothetical protein
MSPSSRTPEGEPNRCPICGAQLRLEASRPAGDAPCPQCGTLVWLDGETAGRPATRALPMPIGRPASYFTVEKVVKVSKTIVGFNESEPEPPFRVNDRVRVLEGPFKDLEGRVTSLDPARLRVTIDVVIFGRSVPVECERRQVEFAT